MGDQIFLHNAMRKEKTTHNSRLTDNKKGDSRQ